MTARTQTIPLIFVSVSDPCSIFRPAHSLSLSAFVESLRAPHKRRASLWLALLVAVLAAATAMPDTAHGQAGPVSIEGSIGAGTWEGDEDDQLLGGFDVFVPLAGSGNSLWFADLRGAFGGNPEISAGSIGTGYRLRYNNVWTLGINGYVDYTESDYDNDFYQFGVGLEALSRDWEARVNGYLPSGSTDEAVASANAALIERNRLVFRAGEETALSGFDGEIGYRVPLFAPNSLTQLKAFAGGYWYEGDDVDSVPGVDGRLELSRAALPGLGNGSRVTLLAGLGYDDELETQGTFLARLRVPLGASNAQQPYDPLYRRVERAEAIRTYVGATGRAETAIYVETGYAAGKVVRVDSDNAGKIGSKLKQGGDAPWCWRAGRSRSTPPCSCARASSCSAAGRA
jgi:hypothetical protein